MTVFALWQDIKIHYTWLSETTPKYKSKRPTCPAYLTLSANKKAALILNVHAETDIPFNHNKTQKADMQFYNFLAFVEVKIYPTTAL